MASREIEMQSVRYGSNDPLKVPEIVEEIEIIEKNDDIKEEAQEELQEENIDQQVDIKKTLKNKKEISKKQSEHLKNATSIGNCLKTSDNKLGLGNRANTGYSTLEIKSNQANAGGLSLLPKTDNTENSIYFTCNGLSSVPNWSHWYVGCWK